MTEHMVPSVNLDSSQNAFFARELEFIKARTFDILYPSFKGLNNGLVPISTEAGMGAESITYQQFEELGLAQFICSYADDLPRADIRGQEFTIPVRSIGASYGYSVQDIRAAELAGRNLQQRQANSARRAIDQKLEQLIWFGNDQYGVNGLLTHPNITRVAAPDNAGGTSTKWADKDPDRILADMNELVNGIIENTKGVEIPDTVLLPIEQYTKIASTRLSDASDTTILQYFLQNNAAGIDTVDWINQAQGAGIGVGGINEGEDVMIAYENSSDKFTFELPVQFETFPAQERNLEFVINNHTRVAGILMYYPLSVAIMEGI